MRIFLEFHHPVNWQYSQKITLNDPAGVMETPTIILTPDGKGYLYTIRRYLADLYVAEGLK